MGRYLTSGWFSNSGASDSESDEDGDGSGSGHDHDSERSGGGSGFLSTIVNALFPDYFDDLRLSPVMAQLLTAYATEYLPVVVLLAFNSVVLPYCIYFI